MCSIFLLEAPKSHNLAHQGITHSFCTQTMWNSSTQSDALCHLLPIFLKPQMKPSFGHSNHSLVTSAVVLRLLQFSSSIHPLLFVAIANILHNLLYIVSGPFYIQYGQSWSFLGHLHKLAFQTQVIIMLLPWVWGGCSVSCISHLALVNILDWLKIKKH